MSRRWTPEEDARLEELYPTMQTDAVAERLNRTRMAVYLRAWQLGVKKAEGYHANAKAPDAAA